jgi:hypothetical protein
VGEGMTALPLIAGMRIVEALDRNVRTTWFVG